MFTLLQQQDLVCSESSLQCFYVNNRRPILERHFGVTLVLTQCFKKVTLILLSVERLPAAPLVPQAAGPGKDAELDAICPSPSGMKSDLASLTQ